MSLEHMLKFSYKIFMGHANRCPVALVKKIKEQIFASKRTLYSLLGSVWFNLRGGEERDFNKGKGR
jgi:hypothetical protein